MELADLFTTAPAVRWFIADVVAVDELASTVTLSYLGGLVPGVGYLDHVVPEQGDVAHGLIWNTNGMLVIGTNTKTIVTHPTLPTQLAPITVEAQQFGTYSDGGWEPGLVQSPTQFACWFYMAALPERSADPGVPVDLAALVARDLSAFEVEVTRTGGGPPEFFAHRSNGVGDELRVADRKAPSNQVPLGVPTWVPLPVGWGEQFVLGNILGVGVGGGYYSGTYSGTGRLRFTPMA